MVLEPARTLVLELERLMNAAKVPAAAPPIVKAKLVVGVPVRAVQPPAEVKRDARNAVALLLRSTRQQVADLPRQRRRDAFVGIERQDPVMAREPRSEVLLIAVAGPWTHLDARSMATGNGHGVVGAVGIDDDDLVGPGHRFERRPDVSRFVVGDDRDGQLHAGECSRASLSGKGGHVPWFVDPLSS